MWAACSERQGENSPLKPPEGIRQEYICVVLSRKSAVTCYSLHRKLIQRGIRTAEGSNLLQKSLRTVLVNSGCLGKNHTGGFNDRHSLPAVWRLDVRGQGARRVGVP